MPSVLRLAAGAGAVLVGLLALHVHLNHGGWPRALRRWTAAGQVRGELVVGFLPVT